MTEETSHTEPAAGASNGLKAVAEAFEAQRVDELWRLARAAQKPVAKAARRALYLLKLRGLEVGEGPLSLVRDAPEVGARPSATDLEPCLATPIDGSGDRALWIPMKRKLGFLVSQSLLSDVRGVEVCEGIEMSRRQLRQFLSGLRRGEGARPIEISRERALALLAEAVALAPEAPAAYDATRLIADATQPSAPASQSGKGAATPLSVSAEVGPDERALLADGPRLFDEVELRSYVPPEDALRTLGAKLDEIAVSTLLVDERQRAEQRRHAVDRLVEATFTEEARRRYARRLFDLSDYFASTGRPLPAARAAATARHLQSAAPILSNPFAHALFARLLREPTPEEAPIEQIAAKEPGLILPTR